MVSNHMVNRQRISNWPTELNNFIETRRATPFQWGKNDCALFAADAVLAITGIDHAAEYRGRYTTRIGSARVLLRSGIKDLRELLSLYFDELAPASVRRGDLACFDTGNGPTIGVCVGQYIVAPGAAGLEWIPMTIVEEGWSI